MSTTTSTATTSNNGKPKPPQTPKFDPDQTKAFLEAMEFDPAIGCAEIRVLKGNLDRAGYIVSHSQYKATYGGYYDRADSLISDARRLNGISGYISVNPLSLDLLGRSYNAIIKAESAAADDDVVCLRWWFVDFDSVRKKGISATDAELARAIARRDQFLTDHPDLAAATHFGCSGNGAWCVIRLPDFPNDAHHRNLIVRATAVLTAKYSDDTVEVDTSTTNAGRVMPLVGTAKCKGSNIPSRPWRLATIDSPPGKREPIDLVAWLERNEPPKPGEPTKDDPWSIPVGPRKAEQGGGDDEDKPEVHHDRKAVAAALKGQYETIAEGWGLKLTEKVTKGWRECRAVGRKDNTPSAGLNVESGVYRDFAGPIEESFFDLGVRLGVYPSWQAAVNDLGERIGLGARTNGKAKTAQSSVTAEDDPSHNFTDLGNAGRLIHHHGKTILYCHDWKCWLTYATGRWNRDRSGAVQGMAKKVSKYILLEIPAAPDQKTIDAYKKFSHESQACKKIRDLMDLARSDVPVLPEQLDADRWSFNMQNGTLDLRTGKLRPHDSRDLCTKQAPVNFEPTVTAPRFEQFEREIFNGDEDLIHYVRRKIGYALTGDDSVQEIDIWHGEGSNGKNLYADTVRALLGDYACQAESSLLLQKRTDDHPTGVADLQGKRFVTASETDDGRRIAEALVKQLTGDAVIKARRMHENFFEFARTFKLFLCTNHKPMVRGTDHAIWRRIRLVPFGVKFVKQGEPTAAPLVLQEDPNLKEKLIAEGPGIINLFLAACLDWQKNGMRPPEAVKAATDEFRSEMDTVSGFLAECCKSHFDNPTIKDVAKVNKTALYEAYCDWCKGNRLAALSTNKFSRELTVRGYELKSSNNNYYRYGISLIKEAGEPPSPEDPWAIRVGSRARHVPDEDEPLPEGLLDAW